MISDKVRSGSTPASWYLRSLADQDTHRGELRPDGTVVAVCGTAFRPRALRSLGSLAGQRTPNRSARRAITNRPSAHQTHLTCTGTQ